ncbi:hypothetical protein Gasu2_35310 [Galdieria sulphuraria]|uniref:F-box domain-containing protein n=1 Tax=Galdieria sulphuraria TaxID=130081 RepID=M2WU47_GALSU|nr:uncharacterized protein Gasu_50280 [Galdieria sulphuraria]EME27435.1 hypothetical protein Gasu_50280 [Galdieria sulphuraria]GJD09272.1 hypothetical protein Gasu2_35310 [Galdieria sulphuraria]|eukprot:XP_005703955.1 hypothetical protein Gasu_50280 [Galdieria sulphuraria]
MNCQNKSPVGNNNNRQLRTVDSELQLDVYGPNTTPSYPLLSATRHPISPIVSPGSTLSLQPYSSLEDNFVWRYGPEGPLFGRLCDDLVAHLISFIPSVQDRAAFREVATRWRRIINETPELWRRASFRGFLAGDRLHQVVAGHETHICVLDLTGCRNAREPSVARLFCSCPHLEEVDLSGIFGIRPETFHQLPSHCRFRHEEVEQTFKKLLKFLLHIPSPSVLLVITDGSLQLESRNRQVVRVRYLEPTQLSDNEYGFSLFIRAIGLPDNSQFLLDVFRCSENRYELRWLKNNIGRYKNGSLIVMQ